MLWLGAIYIGIGRSQLFIARHEWKEIQGGRNGVGIRILSVGSDFTAFQLTALLFVMSLHFLVSCLHLVQDLSFHPQSLFSLNFCLPFSLFYKTLLPIHFTPVSS